MAVNEGLFKLDSEGRVTINDPILEETLKHYLLQEEQEFIPEVSHDLMVPTNGNCRCLAPKEL